MPPEKASTRSSRRDSRPLKSSPHSTRCASSAPLHALQRAEHLEVLGGGQQRVEGDFLRDHAEGLAARACTRFERLSEEGDAAGVGPHAPGDGAHQGGLAGAVRPEQAEAFAFTERQADATESVLLTVAPRQPVDLEHRVHGPQSLTENQSSMMKLRSCSERVG